MTSDCDLYEEIVDWSQETFGNNSERGPIGPLKHLIKEAGEAIEAPKDILEYADCQILVWDAAARAGFSYDELIAAVTAKFAMLKHREYPKTSDGEISEHVKETSPVPANMRADYNSGMFQQTVQQKLGWR